MHAMMIGFMVKLGHLLDIPGTEYVHASSS